MIYTSEDHHIRNDLINPNALYVLKKLHEAGYLAYLVGGGVRDLLMHKRPKDFDISTSAHPEEIKHLFRNCILIGRRFRLAHVRFGNDVIEVSTFRSGDPLQEDLILRDNIWGTPEEDVLRRDFTINGLFYDPLDHRIIDYVGGFEDLKKNTLRCIGEPLVRFRQDPVRMIRMQKFRARFGFEVEKEALNALITCREEIMKSSPARILEELFRMLESGSSHDFFKLLLESKFLEILLPTLNSYFEKGLMSEIFGFLKMADSMNQRGQSRPLERSILTAALIYPIFEHELKNRTENLHFGHIQEISSSLIQDLLLNAFVHFPKKIRHDVQFILHMQCRFTPQDKKKRMSHKFLKQEAFPQALTFLKLRALLNPSLFKIYENWKRLWTADKQDEKQDQ